MTNIKNLWDYSGADQMCFSDSKQESYKKAAEFLGDSVEDWGCGTGWAKRYFKNYKGIDGSPSREVRLEDTVDLREYTSDVDNILMRQTLETNSDWRQIMENAKKSFRKKFCLVVYTPLVDKTRVGFIHEPVRSDGTKMDGEVISEMYFNKQDILAYFPESEYRVREETVDVEIGYGKEWIIYVEKIA
jgi:hypothetical protein